MFFDAFMYCNMIAGVMILSYIIIVQYCQYSLYCALDLCGLFTTYCKFVPLNIITTFPGNYHFTLYLLKIY